MNAAPILINTVTAKNITDTKSSPEILKNKFEEKLY